MWEVVMKRFSSTLIHDVAVTLLLMIAASALGVCFRHWQLHETNVVVVYLLSVLLTARFTKGYFYGLAAAAASFLLFNWFFTEPYYSLKINDPTYIITIIIMTFTAILTSALTSKVMEAAAESREKEAESNALYQMTNHLTDAEDSNTIAVITVRTFSRILSCKAGFVCFDEQGLPEHSFVQQKEDGSQIHRELENYEEFQKRMENLHASHDAGREYWDYPVYGRTMTLGVLRLPSETAAGLNSAQTRLLHSVIESASLALERMRSLQAQAQSREETARERYRSNLLRAISHDLRTPLSGIMGTSEMLMGMTDSEDPRYAMAHDIYQDADWLHGLVENILNLTKFQDGRLPLKKEPEAVEEVIGAALGVMEKRLPGREIGVSIPDSLLMVPMDARLITQVLVNLLDNAAKHTPDDREISVRVSPVPEENLVRFEIADRGCGIKEEALPKIFEMFYTTSNHETSNKRGVGLGLSICQSIVEAHSGTISAENRPGGGSIFTFTLPLEEDTNDKT